MNNSKYILADEPTGALDSETSKQIMNLLLDLNRKGKTIFIITHDKEIASMCSRIILIRDGVICEDASNYGDDMYRSKSVEASL